MKSAAKIAMDCFVGLDYLPLIDPSVFKLNIVH